MIRDEDWLIVLNNSLKRLCNSLSLDILFDEIINTSTEICNSEMGYLELYNDNKSRSIKSFGLKGINEEFINQFNQLFKTDSILEKLFKSKKSIAIKKYEPTLKNIKTTSLNHFLDVKSAILIPIYDISGTSLGLITILTKSTSNFKSDTLRKIEMYARYAEICIDRALKSNQLIKINQELVRKNNKLLTSIKKSKELDIIKNKFVSYVSHELKTPLSTILSSTYLIGVYDKAEHQITRKKHLKRIESCVLHLTDVVDNFLSAKTEHFYSNSLDLNVPNYINQIMDEIKVLCANNQEICYKHVGENIVQINKMIFKNIIYNLLSNAIKYSATTIFISSNIVEEKIKIKVVDFGIGIPENEKSKVFNRFYRAKNVGSIDGTGLGLYISKNLIKQLNGKINVRSKVNEGTTFYVSIPYNGSK